MSKTVPIGRVLSPTGVQEFTFITPDDKLLKIGEFVYYEVNDQQILCRIISRESERQLPPNILSDPAIDPGTILGSINMDTNDFRLYVITAVILGVYDTKMGFQNPRISPSIGQPIYLADDKVLTESINKVKEDDIGSAHIGDLIGRPGRVKIHLDVKEIVSKHISVLAATGSGKSYSVGVLLEELMSEKNRGACLVFDPHGEYHTLTQLEQVAKTADYQPKVKVLKTEDIRFKLSDLSINDFINLLYDLREKMKNILELAWNFARRKAYEDKKNYFTFDDLLNALNDEKVANPRQDSSTINALKWRINSIRNKKIVVDHSTTTLKELFRPGQLTIIQLSESEQSEQQIIAAIILRKILKARIATMRKELTDENENYIDYPVFIVIEEAHRFCPAFGEAKSKATLKIVLSEGRKFGVGICLVSQRPSKLDPDSLSQCLTQVIMKIVNPSDQKNIADSVENVSKDLLQELPGLTKGQAIVAGEAVNTPILIQVRQRKTEHGGESPNAPKIWVNKQKGSLSLTDEEKGIINARPIIPEVEEDVL